MLVIDAAVTHLDNLHCLEDYLANLGRKHQAVGVKVESFEVSTYSKYAVPCLLPQQTRCRTTPQDLLAADNSTRDNPTQ